MKISTLIYALLIVIAGLAMSSMFVVSEREQAFITMFGQPKGDPITTPGLHFKMPFVHEVHRYEKRTLEWDGDPNQVTTKDKKFIKIDIYGRWRIADPLLFFQNVRDELGAQTRLDDVLDGASRSVIARNELVDIVRSIKRDIQLDPQADTDEVNTLPNFTTGRSQIVNEILSSSKKQLGELGIELIDVRFKRITYSPEVQQEIFRRMIAERKRIADRFLSEGQGEAARIEGTRQRELKTIESEAYRKVQEINGIADAEATKIYAEAFNQSADAREFYQFQKTLESYATAISAEDTLVLSTDSEFYRYLKSSEVAE